MEKILTFFQNLKLKSEDNNMKKKVLRAFAWFMAIFLSGGLISRGIYGAMLPRVEIDYPANLHLGHQVRAEGKLVSDKEVVVYGEAGIRIGSILVGEGEAVEADTPLLQYDLDDVIRLIEENEIELQKMQIQIDTLNHNAGLEASQKESEKSRATQDYQNTEEKENQELNQVQNGLDEANRALASHSSKESYIKKRLAEDEEYARQKEEIKRLEKEINKESDKDLKKELKKELDKANKEKDKYQQKIEKSYAQEWEAEKAGLEQAAQDQRQAYDEKGRQKEESLLQAKRALEDAAKNGAKDSSLALLKLDKELLEKKLAVYHEIEKEDGFLKAPCRGTVTELPIKEGERVPDGALMMIANGEEGYRFETQISKEESKYISQGDMVDIKIGSNSQEISVPVLSIEEDAENANLYTVILKVDSSAGSIGDRGDMNCVKKETESTMCVPLSAMRQDQQGKKFIYILAERQTILGMEWVVEKRGIELRGHNKEYASLEAGFLSSQDQVIVDSSKPIMEGDSVRLLSE